MLGRIQLFFGHRIFGQDFSALGIIKYKWYTYIGKLTCLCPSPSPDDGGTFSRWPKNAWSKILSPLGRYLSVKFRTPFEKERR